MAKRKAEGGGRRRLLRLGRFRMQIAKVYNQSAGGTIHIQAVSVGKQERRQTGDHGLLRVAGCICTHAAHTRVRTPWRQFRMQRRTTPRRGSGATLGGRLGRGGVHEDTTESSWWFYGGYTRRIYGRQAEAHQFPIQFADLALPILGDSRERGGIIPSAREMAFPPRGRRIDESFPRLNIEDPSRTASLFFDRCLLRRKKEREGESCEKRQESSRFHIQETLYSAGISGNVLYIPG